MDTVREVALDIAKELKEHPEAWCKGTSFDDDKGCIAWHIYKRTETHPTLRTNAYYSVRTTLEQHVENWNDAPQRTVQDVIDVCERIAQHDQV